MAGMSLHGMGWRESFSVSSNEFNGFEDKIRFFMMWLGAWHGWHLHSPSERMKGLAVLWIDTLPCL
jgi:hypothetical protein